MGFLLVTLFPLHLGHFAVAFIQSEFQGGHLSEESEITIYIAVGTVRMVIELSAKH